MVDNTIVDDAIVNNTSVEGLEEIVVYSSG
jgi:hypothetical protein